MPLPQLLTGFPNNPSGDRIDCAIAFSNGNEIHWTDHSSLRMFPTYQSFKPEQPSGLQRNDRLVKQSQLLSINGVRQIVLHVSQTCGTVTAVEKQVASFAGGFSLVHRCVRIPNNIFRS